MNATEIDRLATFEDWYWWHRARSAIVTSLLRRNLTSRTNEILDVGCGAGATTVALREFGSVLGVDAHSAKAARSRGLAVASMDACRLGLRTASFDVAVALDVLEHLDDDAAAVRELRRVLREDGLLMVSVPAYQWLWSSHDVALGHVRRYTRSRLVSVLEAAGFSVELASYSMPLALPPASVARVLGRLRNRGGLSAMHQSGYVRTPRFANTLLTWLLSLDRLVIGRLPIPWGLSVIAVARKTSIATQAR